MHTCEIDVLVLGYAGHSLHGGTSQVYSLQEQIELADKFVLTLLASGGAVQHYHKHLYLAGHSIGGYVAMHLLSRYSAFSKLFGLCPVLMHVAASPKGQRLRV
uniref:Lipid droplet-associated hydrolase n=1 Tax=Lygus hesperus TaxID=30085 RepID=A0A0A9WYF2_LYGHE